MARPKGSGNKAKSELANAIRRAGVSPKDFMLDNLAYYARKARIEEKKGLKADEGLIDKYRSMAQSCAKDVAPYIHARLQSTELKGNDESPIKVQIEFV